MFAVLDSSQLDIDIGETWVVTTYVVSYKLYSDQCLYHLYHNMSHNLTANGFVYNHAIMITAIWEEAWDIVIGWSCVLLSKGAHTFAYA